MAGELISVGVGVVCSVMGAGVMAIVKERARQAAREDDALRESVQGDDDRARMLARQEVGAEIRVALAELKAELPALLNGPTGYRRKAECELISGGLERRLDVVERDVREAKAMAHESPCAAARALREHLK